MAAQISTKDANPGFYVMRGRRPIGLVCDERTGTIWTAYVDAREIGRAETKEAAIDLVVAATTRKR